jgi:hypothetical protein
MVLDLNLKQKVGVVVAGGDPGWSFSFGLRRTEGTRQNYGDKQFS